MAVVEAVEKPGNLGAIARSADGAGADALIAADPRTDPFNPNA
ncbi:MAG: TrmH family RNA methyltransferase, partial [Candidatus Limnocylindrales bacterium]